MNPSRQLLLIPLLMLAACLSSCETTTPGDLPDSRVGQTLPAVGADNPGALPPAGPPQISWAIHPEGVGYDLDLTLNGEEHHIDRGGEYMRGHPATLAELPPAALSGYEVDMPDGEAMLYWVEPHDSGHVVYGRFWDPVEGRYLPKRRLASIR